MLAHHHRGHVSGDKQVYFRADPDAGRAIEVELFAAGCAPSTGRVVDVYLDGISARFGAQSSPQLAIGKRVYLRLQCRVPKALIELEAVVRDREEGSKWRSYGFRFSSRSELEGKLPMGLYSIFNRRRHYRVRLSAPERVVVAPVYLGDKSGRAQLAWLSGASLSGVSLLVDPQTEQKLSTFERLALSIGPPVCESPLELVVRVRNRQLADEGRIRYGCEMADEGLRGAAHPSRERLLEALMQREGARLSTVPPADFESRDVLESYVSEISDELPEADAS